VVYDGAVTLAADTTLTLSTTVALGPYSPLGSTKQYFGPDLPPGLYGPVKVQITAATAPKLRLDDNIVVDVDLQMFAITGDFYAREEEFSTKEVVPLGQYGVIHPAYSNVPMKVYGQGSITGNVTNNGSGDVDVTISIDRIGDPW
jgi:hypothetical protein